MPYVGTVVNGLLNCGTVKKGDPVLFGPDSNGGYSPTVVKTMQRKRADVATAVAGQTVSLALKHVPRAAVRKGMVIVHRTEVPPRGMQLALLSCNEDVNWGFSGKKVRRTSFDFISQHNHAAQLSGYVTLRSPFLRSSMSAPATDAST